MRRATTNPLRTSRLSCGIVPATFLCRHGVKVYHERWQHRFSLTEMFRKKTACLWWTNTKSTNALKPNFGFWRSSSASRIPPSQSKSPRRGSQPYQRGPIWPQRPNQCPFDLPCRCQHPSTATLGCGPPQSLTQPLKLLFSVLWLSRILFGF